jgi:hypothetical protein
MMARTLVALAALTALGACFGRTAANPEGNSSQDSYQYGGCPKYAGDCPGEGTLACALKTIVTKYNACSKHEDCVAAAFEAKCSGAGACPPFYVNRQLKGGFEAEAQQEIDKYCATATCKGGAPCGIIQMEPYCANAHCTWIRTFSGGPY